LTSWPRVLVNGKVHGSIVGFIQLTVLPAFSYLPSINEMTRNEIVLSLPDLPLPKNTVDFPPTSFDTCSNLAAASSLCWASATVLSKSRLSRGY
jgi:hypothetical protein